VVWSTGGGGLSGGGDEVGTAGGLTRSGVRLAGGFGFDGAGVAAGVVAGAGSTTGSSGGAGTSIRTGGAGVSSAGGTSVRA